MSRARVLVLNGPNLDRLGTRQPELYGTTTLAQITDRLDRLAEQLGVDLQHVQSNHEGILIDAIGAPGLAGAVVNAAAYTHTSVALRDAISGSGALAVEIHLSNVHAREAFRHHSFIAPVCAGVICGFGPDSYSLGLDALVRLMARRRAP